MARDDETHAGEPLAIPSVAELTALRQSEERFRTICEHAPVMIDAFDADGRCILWNRECERTLGYSHDEIASSADALTLTYPDPAMRRKVRQSLARADGRYREYEVRARDGSVRIQLWADFRLPNGARISVGHDVTHQRETEATLRQTQKMDALGQLTGSIAHDFNNLLTVVLANATMMERRVAPVDAEQRWLLGAIRTAATDAAELVRKLLAFSRREPLSFRTVDLSELVNEQVATLRRLVAATIVIDTDLAPGLPPVNVDPGAIQQILINLATNARDAMPDGGALRITVQREPTPTGEYVALRVRDDGSGMSAATCSRAFEPFFTTKPRGAGTGLGLATVFSLAVQHGGVAQLRSQPGEGTTVTVLLPPSSNDRAAPVAAALEVVEAPERGSILFVEDQEQVREAALALLEEQGYDVLLAANGRQALETLEQVEGIDLVVTDVVMPEVDGFELYRHARKRGHCLPFLFTSGYRGQRDLALREGLGEVAVLDKPWTVAELLAAVRRAMRRPPGD